MQFKIHAIAGALTHRACLRRIIGMFFSAIALIASLHAQSDYATPYAVSAPAGSAFGLVDATGSAARFGDPFGVAVDGEGNVYVADADNNRIRMITSAAVVTTVAGSPLQSGSADGTGSAARFGQPRGIAADAGGNLFIADSGNHTIRPAQVAPPTAPVITTQPADASMRVGGSAVFSVSAGGIPLPSYQWQLNGVAIRGATSATLTISNVRVADGGIYTVVVTNALGSATSNPATLTVTGPISATVNFTSTNYVSIPGIASGPNGIAVDGQGNEFVTVGDAVEKVTTAGELTPVAGSLTSPGSADGTGSAASFNQPTGLATDSAGNVYVADSGNNSIRKITPLGAVTTLAGQGEGDADGVGTAAQFDDPTAVAVDGQGNVYVVDRGNNELREIAPNGRTTTAIPSSAFQWNDGIGTPLYSITGVAVDAEGTAYVGASVYIYYGLSLAPPFYGAAVFEVTSGETLIRLWEAGDTGDGPAGLLTIGSTGAVCVVAGTTVYSSNDGGTGSLSLLGSPLGFAPPSAIAADSGGLLYVTSSLTHSIAVVSLLGSGSNIANPLAGGALAFGASATLTLTVDDPLTPVTYQWQLDGSNISGATGLTFVTDTPGNYTVEVTDSVGSETSSAAVVTAATRLANISSRAYVGTGDSVETAGFVVSGPPGITEQVLVRGVGPSLAQFGVTGLLANPVLTLYDVRGDVVAANAGWTTATNATQIAAAATSTGAFALPAGSADSALLVDLPPGDYTAQISGLNASTGVALAEVYEMNNGDPELVNLSTRAFVSIGSSVEIGGFVVTGSQPAKVLVRAVGPALGKFGVSGILAQPSLTVVDHLGNPIAANTGWSTNADPAAIAAEMTATGAFALPSGSADCALLLTLPPGEYTAVVSGVNATSGIALVEVYQAP